MHRAASRCIRLQASAAEEQLDPRASSLALLDPTG